MARPIRVFDGSFGRLQLVEASTGEAPQTCPAPQIIVKQEGTDLHYRVDGEFLHLSRANLLFLNPGATSQALFEAGAASAPLLCFPAPAPRLPRSFPAVFGISNRAFVCAGRASTGRTRQ